MCECECVRVLSRYTSVSFHFFKKRTINLKIDFYVEEVIIASSGDFMKGMNVSESMDILVINKFLLKRYYSNKITIKLENKVRLIVNYCAIGSEKISIYKFFLTDCDLMVYR